MDEVLKFILQYVLSPVVLFVIATGVYLYKTQARQVEALEQRVSSVETSTAVIRVMVDAIHQDIRDIKRAIEKLADRGP